MQLCRIGHSCKIYLSHLKYFVGIAPVGSDHVMFAHSRLHSCSDLLSLPTQLVSDYSEISPTWRRELLGKISTFQLSLLIN